MIEAGGGLPLGVTGSYEAGMKRARSFNDGYSSSKVKMAKMPTPGDEGALMEVRTLRENVCRRRCF